MQILCSFVYKRLHTCMYVSRLPSVGVGMFDFNCICIVAKAIFTFCFRSQQHLCMCVHVQDLLQVLCILVSLVFAFFVFPHRCIDSLNSK